MTKTIILSQLDAWEEFIKQHIGKIDLKNPVKTLWQGRLLMIKDIRRMFRGETVLPPKKDTKK
jgi:PIN domain nuclease of toxin-antitoxin system